MAESVIHQLVLKSHPFGEMSLSDYGMATVPMPSTLQPGQLLVRVIYLSIDAAIRMYTSKRKTYWKTVQIGECVPTIGLGEVAKSASKLYKEGDIVRGIFDCATYSLASESEVFPTPRGIPHLPSLLGNLGHHGLTAYVGLVSIAKVKAGETVLVSAAAGATGSIVLQIAKLLGCRVIGIVGTEAKRSWVTRALSADGCFNYSSADDLTTAIRTLCPNGVDVYWDSVGGRILDVGLTLVKPGGRVVLCGAISGYNQLTEEPVNALHLAVTKGISMRGFIVKNFAEDYKQAVKALSTWTKEKKLVSKEVIIQGLERIPEGLQTIFNHDSFGKLIAQVGDLPRSQARL